MTDFHLVRRDLDRKTHDAAAARSQLGGVLPAAVRGPRSSEHYDA